MTATTTTTTKYRAVLFDPKSIPTFNQSGHEAYHICEMMGLQQLYYRSTITTDVFDCFVNATEVNEALQLTVDKGIKHNWMNGLRKALSQLQRLDNNSSSNSNIDISSDSDDDNTSDTATSIEIKGKEPWDDTSNYWDYIINIENNYSLENSIDPKVSTRKDIDWSRGTKVTSATVFLMHIDLLLTWLRAKLDEINRAIDSLPFNDQCKSYAKELVKSKKVKPSGNTYMISLIMGWHCRYVLSENEPCQLINEQFIINNNENSNKQENESDELLNHIEQYINRRHELSIEAEDRNKNKFINLILSTPSTCSTVAVGLFYPEVKRKSKLSVSSTDVIDKRLLDLEEEMRILRQIKQKLI